MSKMRVENSNKLRLSIAVCALLLLFGSVNSFGQNDINIRNWSGRSIDLVALDTYFDQVHGATNVGTPVTFNGTNAVSFGVSDNFLPTNASALNGVDLVFIGQGPFGWMTQEQIDLFVDYVKAGGVLIVLSEAEKIYSPRNGIRPSYYGQYLANQFLCSDAYIIHQTADGDAGPEASSTRCDVPTPYHPGNGNLNLTAPGWLDVVVGSGSYKDLVVASSAWYVGVPPENAILYCNPNDGISGSSGTDADCGNQAVLEMVFPANPGTSNDCDIQGMALISGEFNGILTDSDRADLQYNYNFASLIYDFIHDPVAMAVRNAWSASPANVNTDCPGEALFAQGAGTIDCGKTQIASAPVAGVPGQKNLMVTINVTNADCFSPIVVSGSGMRVANGLTEVCANGTGLQTFSIPVDYDGSALGTMNFSIGEGNTCSADLTLTPKDVITPIYTLDCVPVVGPRLN